MPFDIRPWRTIAANYNATLLLGNGASIAVSDTFAYQSLLEHARKNGLVTEDVERLFDFFETSDFELILRIVWHATNVNKSLSVQDERTASVYRHVRDALIQAVRDIHPPHEQISPALPDVRGYLKSFQTVISLNYDLVVYWAMLQGNEEDHDHQFKDCFVGGQFDDDWSRFREPIRGARSTTLVFYPHGNLIFCRDRIEEERKIHSGGAGLLEAILDEWESEEFVPIFVSEGTHAQKAAAIKSSYYLSTVYREVLPSPQPNLTIYGWGLGEHDLHLLQKMRGAGIQRVAVSVFGNDQAYCNRAFQVIHEALGDHVEVEFFDSLSPGCWIHAEPGGE